ncbi:hypothetical protein ACFWY5_23850 [Nonomuraea sp. NPDC059007]|uniref:hypothetical protein n=1 Tax=Nonomuraea sp. NPDC059007 TaxID=3346692 RepID=UPI0036B2240B
MKKRLAIIVLTVAAAAPALVASTPAAAQAQALACGWIERAAPAKVGNYVKSAVATAGCARDEHFTYKLQRQHWYGWENVDTADWWGNGSDTLAFYCRGSGNYNYRVRSESNKSVIIHHSNDRNISC